LGGLLRILEKNSLLEDTILLFTSDHGDNLGSHDMYNKDVLYEEAIRIPMIFHCPDKLGKRTVDTQVASLVDMAPTLLSLAGVDVPDKMQGTDISSVVKGEAREVGANAAFIETTSMTAGIRTMSHLYGVKTEKGADGQIRASGEKAMFFDVPSDPFQERNLIETGEQKELGAELHKRVMDWDKNTPWMKMKA
jgi:arylsulfatase A-like enzyme